MIFGGVPYYLNFINKNFSLVQNIDNLFFKEGGELANEFDNLFYIHAASSLMTYLTLPSIMFFSSSLG